MNDVDVVRNSFASLKPEIVALFRQLWAEPELGGLEVRSSRRLADWLQGHGFAITRQAGGIPTAFLARRQSGKGGPRIALLAEYDALPGLANKAVAERTSASGAGHACGHNHIGPANSAAAIIAAEAARKLNLAGEIAVIGCPAEEILWGKIALLNKGVFAGFDAILTSHGDYQLGALSRPCTAVYNGEFVFLGTAGHGGFAGKQNALAGAEAATAAIEAMLPRDFADCTAKHVLRRAGIMPSITPDEVRLWYTARGLDMTRVRACYDAIARICSTTAKEHGLGFRYQHIAESRGYLANDVLGRIVEDAIEDIGAPQFRDSDIAFMEDLAKACGADGPLVLDQMPRLHDQGADYYGQDDGEVSWRIPLGRMNWAYPQAVPIHHWAWTALSGHEASDAGPLMTSQALALVALRLLAEPARIVEAKAELARRVEGIDVDAPRLGAWRTMTTAPQSFWDASWVE
jgi:aminobenzoyl-glutamate utilization protein B